MCSPVKKLAAAGGLTLLLAGCADALRDSTPSLSEMVDERLSAVDAPVAGVLDSQTEAGQILTPTEESARAIAEQVETGTGQFINPAVAQPAAAAAAEDGDIILNFQAADLQEVVKVILGDLMGQNYVIDPGVTGTISTDTTQGLSKEDLLPVLDTLLALNQAALVQEHGVYRVVPISKAIKGSIRPAYQLPRADGGISIQIMPLRFVAVAEMQKILEPILNEGALVYVDEKRNLLLLAGTPQEQRRYRETVAMFDVDWMRGMSVGLFPLTYVEPKDLVKELELALGGEGGKIMDGLVRLVPIDRLGALLAVSATSSGIREIERWIDRLDVASDKSAPRLFVYRLQNAKAADVAALLSEIFGGAQPAATRPGVPLAPGTRPVTLTTPTAGEAPAPAQPTPATGADAPGTAISIAVGENLRIIADENYNSLVILATPKEYEIIESAIRKLDVIPLQVLIEATIVEVTLSDSLEYGVEWFFKNSLSSGANPKKGRARLDLGAPGLVPFAPAFSYAIVDSADEVRAVLNFLATESHLNVLSSPSLMVLDNQTASINVGDEIPIPTRQSTSNLDATAPTVNEIQYRATGVTLTVTPRVNAGGLVTMEVQQEVSDAVPTTSSDLNAPTIQQRTITSTVAVQSGNTVVLGGLIRSSNTINDSGVPYVRKIPVFGKLFGQTSDIGRRTELLVLISPRAINDGREAQAVTREFRDKLQGLSGAEFRRVPY